MSRPKVQNKCRDYNNIKIVLLMSMIHINYLETQAWHLSRRNINKLMSIIFYKPSSCGTVRKLKNLVFPSLLRNLLKKNAGRRKIILAKEKYCLKLSWKKKCCDREDEQCHSTPRRYRRKERRSQCSWPSSFFVDQIRASSLIHCRRKWSKHQKR